MKNLNTQIAGDLKSGFVDGKEFVIRDGKKVFVKHQDKWEAASSDESKAVKARLQLLENEAARLMMGGG